MEMDGVWNKESTHLYECFLKLFAIVNPNELILSVFQKKELDNLSDSKDVCWIKNKSETIIQLPTN